MRLGQSAADADTLTRARPLATSTESVSCHTEENLGVDQWYKSMSRSPPATVHAQAGGVWGPAARGSFNGCLKLADSDRNVDLYHWSSAKFSSTWYDTLSVLVAKGRARVSVAASEADWSKRIREMQYADYEDHTVGS